jgi:hypothetical protein
LPACIESVVDTNSYSDVLVEFVRPVLLVELVLDLFLKAVVEYIYKPFVVDISSQYILAEQGSIGYSRLGLAELSKAFLGMPFLVDISKHLLDFFYEISVLLEDLPSKVLLVVLFLVQAILQRRFEPAEYLSFEV